MDQEEKDKLEQIRKQVHELKTVVVKKQKFELAAKLRMLEKAIVQLSEEESNGH